MTEEIQDRLYPVLMHYTPGALNTLPRDRLSRELAEALEHCDVLAFTVPSRMHGPINCTADEIAERKRGSLNALALEAAARAVVLAILAVVEVRQR